MVSVQLDGFRSNRQNPSKRTKTVRSDRNGAIGRSAFENDWNRTWTNLRIFSKKSFQSGTISVLLGRFLADRTVFFRSDGFCPIGQFPFVRTVPVQSDEFRPIKQKPFSRTESVRKPLIFWRFLIYIHTNIIFGIYMYRRRLPLNCQKKKTSDQSF